MKIDDEKLAFSQFRQDRRERDKQSLGTITVSKKKNTVNSAYKTRRLTLKRDLKACLTLPCVGHQ